MSEQEDNRSRWYNIRLKPDEYQLLNGKFKKTQFRKLSEYMRSLLLDKPVTVTYRDKAMDDMLEEMVLLRQELNAIGNNLNQAMRNINSAHGNADARLWMNLLSVINTKLEPSIQQIKDRMNQYADIWSQKLKAAKA
ncbi:plasmid mobilization relaxosome protein MobC [Mucilaginibacter sp. ZT4R22]|uniref:Plasmid mobilization relaxosome protein MobC n=1 Tax=Mucilaginibacter pankratovii TaxID=2772110 RepID=A0ABR7WLF1_9SPHI|nr:plasmid mobilization relaxosome protein MobC [Mucilaginibacter pankratovii]MBD1362943.1 plasmid mobilization relaxosome protein MobC [Mucilaginibacter pankratovii]